MRRHYDVLRIDPQEEPIYLLVRSMGVEPDVAEYTYEEAQCPHDTFARAEEVFQDGDPDPHGLFTYIRTIEVDIPAESYDPIEVFGPHVPEALVRDSDTRPKDGDKGTLGSTRE